MTVVREIQKLIEGNLFPGGEKQPAIVIYGARQVGKTTLVKQILAAHPEKALYFNCDYMDVQQQFSWENIGSIGSLIKDTKLLILDEAQRITNIGLILKILVDEYPLVQVIATGSSSFELANLINEPLTGRKKVFPLHPFSWEEVSSDSNIIERQRMLNSKLRFGMYPGLLNLNDHDAALHLKELSGSYLFKDIYALQQIKKPESLEKLLRLLAFQIGQEVSFQELGREIRTDQTIVQRYIHLLEENFIIFRLGAFKKNLRNEISKSRKIFFWDLGIRNSLIQNHNPIELRDDAGALWENFSIAERLKFHHNRQQLCNAFFWRTYQQKEIDYIEEKDGKLAAFEMKWGANKRISAPKEFLQAYPKSTFQVVSPQSFEAFLQEDI
jgi:predicted AAA+ superfamily ATPase